MSPDRQRWRDLLTELEAERDRLQVIGCPIPDALRWDIAHALDRDTLAMHEEAEQPALVRWARDKLLSQLRYRYEDRVPAAVLTKWGLTS